MKLNITIDGKTYEVEVDAAEPESPAGAPHNLSGLNIGSAPLRVPAAAAPVRNCSALPTRIQLSVLQTRLRAVQFGHINPAKGDSS